MYGGISGNEFDKFVERFEHKSTLSKVHQQYWEAKQAFLQKIAKKEDDCVISYDSELDIKLELFKSIVETCQRLLCTLECYQDRIFMLAHEENCTGRFLKKVGQTKGNLIDKMLTATGKTLCYIAQQRIQIGVPLVNIYNDLETFQYKAISDTLCTIEQMEKERTSYRASLLWIKSLSSKLDPDSYSELEKFRKVQNHVRRTKQKYDKRKVDCIQKIDMLSTSRCNLISQTLCSYQKVWLDFWKNTNSTLESISNCFQDCHDYEFTVLKDLQICSSKEATEDEKLENENKNKNEDNLLLINIEDKKGNDLILENKYKKKGNEFNKEIDLIKNDDNILLNLDKLGKNESMIKNKYNKSSSSSKEEKTKHEIEDLLTPKIIDNEDLLMLDAVSIESKNLSDSIFDQIFTELNTNENVKKESSKDKDKNKNITKSNIEWLKIFSELDPFSKNENNNTLDIY